MGEFLARVFVKKRKFCLIDEFYEKSSVTFRLLATT